MHWPTKTAANTTKRHYIEENEPKRKKKKKTKKRALETECWDMAKLLKSNEYISAAFNIYVRAHCKQRESHF